MLRILAALTSLEAVEMLWRGGVVSPVVVVRKDDGGAVVVNDIEECRRKLYRRLRWIHTYTLGNSHIAERNFSWMSQILVETVS